MLQKSNQKNSHKKNLAPDLKKRARTIQKMLNQLYRDPPPPLFHQDAFTLLVAVALSAQTTDAHVNKVTPNLFKTAPTPEKMAKLSVEKILDLIRGCNYAPTKAKNLKRLAELLIEKHQGQVPKSFEALEALPGVGHKTASVVMSQAFGIPAFPVDTHIHRLAHRWKLSKNTDKSGKNVVQTEKDLQTIFPDSSWNKLHIQIILYGREHCTARGCDGTLCPICKKLKEY